MTNNRVFKCDGIYKVNEETIFKDIIDEDLQFKYLTYQANKNTATVFCAHSPNKT